MRTHPTPSRAKSKPIATSSQDKDVLSLLTEDHDHVTELFDQYEELGERAFASKRKLAIKICNELTRHSMVEEELFYPAVREADEDNAELIDEAIVEHAAAKDLISQIQTMEADEELFDATVKVLSEQIAHHIQEEESEIFPKARQAGLDLDALAQAVMERKREITLPSA